jgi:seryl-tRNA synthetase
MLDPQYVRKNVEAVKQNMIERKMNGGVVDEWLVSDQKRKEVIASIEEIRKLRNDGAKNSDSDRERMREAKKNLKEQEETLDSINLEWNELFCQIPNIHTADVPIGKTETENVTIFQSDTVTSFDFTPKDHVELLVPRNLIDFERGTKVAGSQFYFLQGDMVLLEMAVTQFILDYTMQRGYLPLHTPDMARSRYYLGTGYNPRGDEAQTYEIKDEDLGLIATAEVTTAGYHADEIIPANELPKKYIAMSHCFRKEAGSYGKYSRGLYRTHQFTKLELFIFCQPSESKQFHEEILDIEKGIMEVLNIPYRVLNICSGDLGSMAAKKYDVEAWMPGRNDFGEVTSTSNCTDYQARNLNIKFRDNDGTIKYAHMLNGTAGALSRLLLAIVENYQQADGSILIPDALQKFMVGNKKVI